MNKFLIPVVAALFSAPIRAQQPGDLPPGPITESVTVAVTDVDVVVTDSRGRRVPGLKMEDFQVFEDGIPQKVTNFYAVSGGQTTLSDGTAISLTSEETGKEAEEIPANLRARYLIYVDNLNIDPLHRNRVFDSVKTFLEKAIGPNAEGMIVTYNRSLKVKQRFTSDKGILVGALDAIEEETGGATSVVSERKDTLQRINDAKSESEAMGVIQQSIPSLDFEIRGSIDALKQTIDGLAGVEGRKILIYLSDGLPQVVGEEFFDTIQQKFRSGNASMESFNYDRTSSYATIVQSANSQGVTIYTIDASGLTVDEGVSAENATMQNRPSSFALRQNMQGPLQTLANETGGIAAVNTNRPDAQLNEIAADFSDFYSIGYRSTRGAVDRPHTIEVKVLKPGLRARYRSGYQEKTIETRTAEAVTAALFYPRTDNPMKLSVAVGDPKPYGAVNYLVPVKISIPLASVTLVPEADIYRGRLYIYFVVLDSDNNQSDLQIRPLDIKVDRKRYEIARQKDYGYDVQLVMIPGGQKLSVAVRDSVSGVVAFAQKSVFVSVLPPSASEKKSEPAAH